MMTPIEWTWDEKKFGPAEHYGVDVGVVERFGLILGEYVVATEDTEMVFEGDEGTVIGFTKAIAPGEFGGGHGERVLVKWDGMDPSPIDADMIEISD